MTARAERNRRLVLHFDINKTIIMKDPVKNIETDGMLNSLLSECVWGTVRDPGRAPSDWAALSSEPSAQAPVAGAVTFGDYVENVLKLPRAERNALKTAFVSPGAPGERCADALERLRAVLRCPPSVGSGASAGLMAELCQDGYYHILPSFFKLLTTLSDRRVDFRLVFRTFGVDIERVASELNLFCEGQHPLSMGRLDGSDGRADRRLHLPQRVCVLSRGPGLADATVTCTDAASGSPSRRGLGAVGAQLNEWFEEGHHTAAVQDDFSFWSSQGESDNSGKLLIVEDGDLTQHIFFDDNIERDRAHIVDVRRGKDLASVPFEEAIDKYIVKAEPYQAITNELYFVEMVDKIVEASTVAL